MFGSDPEKRTGIEEQLHGVPSLAPEGFQKLIGKRFDQGMDFLGSFLVIADKIAGNGGVEVGHAAILTNSRPRIS